MQLQQWQQQLLGAAVRGDDMPGEAIKPAGLLSAAEALAVYQNNTLGSRINALVEIYACCVNILGADYFRQLCRAYARSQRSTSPDLNTYGADFSTFIATELQGRAELAAFDYLPDLARLEWQIHQLQATSHAAADSALLADAANLRFDLHRDCRLLCADFPVDKIYCLNQQGSAEAVHETAPPPYYILLQNRAYQVSVQRIDQPQFQLLRCLQGDSLAQWMAHCPELAEQLPGYLPNWIGAGYLYWEASDEPG